VQLSNPARDYTIRVAGVGLNQKLFASGTLSYLHGSHKNIPAPSINYAGANTSESVRFLVDTSVVPYPPVHPAPVVDQTFKLLLNRTGAAWQWTLNNDQAFNESLEDINPPLLWSPPTNNVLSNTALTTVVTKNNTWVDIIFQVTNTSGLQPPHPLHKHSNKAHIIGSGSGDFLWPDVAAAIKTIPENFDLVNPPYRDGFVTLPVLGPSTWLAIRYHVVNPGAFLLHCHINPHLTGGMA
jgi:FtsP/CotA-like multicopper oxidase with cupredoxin domain